VAACLNADGISAILRPFIRLVTAYPSLDFMRLLTCAIALTFFSLLSISSNGQEKFPDNIQVVKSEKFKRVKGTRVFVVTPDNYQPVESMMRMQRDSNTYLRVLEAPGANFPEMKSKLTKEALEKKGTKIDIYQSVKYNEYEATYYVGPSTTAGETKIVLAFGDKDFVVMLTGTCQTSDKRAIDELNKIFSSSYYEKALDLDPLDLAYFKFDESITGFKYLMFAKNVYFYTPNGKEDLNKSRAGRDALPGFQFSEIKAPTFAKAKEILDTLISDYDAQGVDISKVTRQDITINGNPAYEVILQAKDAGGDKATLYHVIIHKDTKAVMFLCSDSESGKWLDKFKATARSIKM
jgi:hypothetical protein